MNLLRKRKNNGTQPFFKKCSEPCQEKRKKPVKTHRQNPEVTSLTVRGKNVQLCFLVSESKPLSLKQVFVSARQVYIDHF